MKYFIEKLSLAQIDSRQINKELLSKLEAHASYKDADKELDECLVSVDALLNIKEEALEENNVFLANRAIEMHEQVVEFNYIQIAKI